MNELNDQQIAACVSLLQELCDDPGRCLSGGSPYIDVMRKAQLLTKRVRQLRRQEEKRRDLEVRAGSGIREMRAGKEYGKFLDSSESASTSSDARPKRVRSARERRCYICKERYRDLDEFYDALCPTCADENWSRRIQTADLSNRKAVLTGGRIKIGFQIGLMLLRSGAELVVSTRFPYDAITRYQQEEDYAAWQERLTIAGCDFHDSKAVDQLCAVVEERFDCLDILINNAAQTIRRPPAFYRHLREREAEIQKCLADDVRKRLSVSSVKSKLPAQQQEESLQSFFPVNQLDVDGQQIDRRPSNSWILPLGDVGLRELLEVHAVSSLTPFLLIQRLQPLLERSPHEARYVVNVSAMEGRFSGADKTGFHVHTNMAKAGLNMITRTSGELLSRTGIYMNSVDTGWVTNEFPMDKTAAMRKDGFEPPLDEVDGAARVCDPIFRGENGEARVFGKFLKDYKEISW